MKKPAVKLDDLWILEIRVISGKPRTMSVCFSDMTVHTCSEPKRNHNSWFFDLVILLLELSREPKKYLSAQEIASKLSQDADFPETLKRALGCLHMPGRSFSVTTEGLNIPERNLVKEGLAQKLISWIDTSEGRSYRLNIGSPDSSYLAATRTADSLLDLAEQLGFIPNEAGIETENRRKNPACIGGALFLWLDEDLSLTGLTSDGLKVENRWSLRGVQQKEKVGPKRLPYPKQIEEAVQKLLENEESRKAIGAVDPKTSNPKVWVRSCTPPDSESPQLSLTLAGTDYNRNRAVEYLYKNAILSGPGGKPQTLKNLLDLDRTGTYLLDECIPGILGAHLIVRIIDTAARRQFVMVTQKGKNAYEAKAHSLSCEESFDSRYDVNPFDTVRRCLREEFNLGLDDSLEIPEDDIRLLALFREWGANWNTCLLYRVDLYCTTKFVGEQWTRVRAQSRSEHIGIKFVEVTTTEQRIQLLRNALASEVTEDTFQSADGVGEFVYPKPWHQTSTPARAYLGLRSWYEPVPGELEAWKEALSRPRRKREFSGLSVEDTYAAP